MNKLQLVLASASKPRAQIMAQMGLQFTQHATMCPEDLDPRMYPTCEAYCDATCRLKCDSITTSGDTVYVTADTVVIVSAGGGGDVLLEKPRDYEDARRMLALHVEYKRARVYTSICVRRGDCVVQRGRTTVIWFRPDLTQSDINTFLRAHYKVIRQGSGALVVLGPTCLLVEGVSGVDGGPGCMLNSAGLSPAVLLDLLQSLPSPSSHSH